MNSYMGLLLGSYAVLLAADAWAAKRETSCLQPTVPVTGLS